MSMSNPHHASILRLGITIAVLCAVAGSPAGCGTQLAAGPATDQEVLVSVMNVTAFDVSVLLSGILDDAVDTVSETIGPSGNVDVTFVCIDELVVGDPLDAAVAGVTIDVDGDPAEMAPFSIARAESFDCGDVIEIIVSGSEPGSFAVDVFALTLP